VKLFTESRVDTFLFGYKAERACDWKKIRDEGSGIFKEVVRGLMKLKKPYLSLPFM
jgi:hypothetical protein